MTSIRLVTLALLLLLLLVAWAVTPNQACHTASLPDTDELTAGPYWLDPELNRSNITQGQPGTPFTLVLRVWNKTQIEHACAETATGNHTNAPIQDGVGTMPGVQVDIWYANASGHYSGFAAEGTAGQTWLRGYQFTNASGYVEFQSIFPGRYTGRTTHIHVRIRVKNSGTQVYDDTTQLFFDDALSDSVYSSNSLYSHGSGRDTSNSQDGMYQSIMQMSVTGSTAGYQGAFDIYYPFVATGSSGGGGGGGAGGTQATPTPTQIPTTATPTTVALSSAPSNTTLATDAPSSSTPTTVAPVDSSSSSSTGLASNRASSRVMSMSPVAVGFLVLLSTIVSCVGGAVS